jgi:crotonobetainyl-CoA:carnitine CoA-transferase CaiB-like acyl-CoA transferase
VQAADLVQELPHPIAGRTRLLRFPIELSTGRAAVRRPPPTSGQHTDEILGEHGFGQAEIDRLRSAGAI